MPSGKQSKRLRAAAKAAPPAVRTPGGRAKTSPRALLLAACVVVLVAVAAGVGAALTHGSKQASVPARGSLVGALPGSGEVNRMLRGIPQHGNVLGSQSAPVTLVEYIDLQCPYCQQFETQVMPELIFRYVRTGKVRIETRPIAFVGPDSHRGRFATIAAGRQNRLFDYTHVLYMNQGAENTGWLDAGMAAAAAASIPGVDVHRLLADSDSAATRSAADGYDRQAVADAVQATPTLRVGRTGKPLAPVELSSPTDMRSVAAAIDAALRG